MNKAVKSGGVNVRKWVRDRIVFLAMTIFVVGAGAYIGSEKVAITQLDSVVSDYITPSSRTFIKIDTQGFEWQVLDGASETLKNAQGVLCEMSLVPLYEGQKLWMEMLKRLESEGFTLWAIQRGFTDPRDGRSLQMDAIFYRLDS